MRISLIALGVVAVLVAAMLLIPRPENRSGGKPVEGLPWQIEVLPDGASRVFGLTLGTSTLGDSRFEDMEIAIVVAPDEAGSLEAFVQNATLGAVTGKLILTGDVPSEILAGMMQRVVKADYMQSTTKKLTLADQDLPAARAAKLRAIAFIPSINLDEEMIVQRFGPPVERIRSSKHAEHFLYPAKGLDIILDSEGKELLQYVAPRDFDRLREPLKTQGATK